jgi:hypothetical protein
MIFNRHSTLVIKGAALLMMLNLHLLGVPTIQKSLAYSFTGIHNYIGSFGGICVAIFVFLTGYGFSLSEKLTISSIVKKSFILYSKVWRIGLVFIPLFLVFGLIKFSVKSLLSSFLCLGGYNFMWWYVAFYPLLLISLFLIQNVKIKTQKNAIWFLVGICFLSILISILPNPHWNGMIVYLFKTQYFSFLPFLAMGFLIGKFSFFNKFILSTRLAVIILILEFIFSTLIQIYLANLFNGLFLIIYNIFTVPLFILSINQLSSLRPIDWFLSILGKHSLNIWLIHGFFYYYLFKPFYWFKYWIFVVLIFFIVNLIVSILWNRIDTYLVSWSQKIVSIFNI